MITVLLPQFVVNKWWEVFLHSQTNLSIASALIKEESGNIVVSVLPFALKNAPVPPRSTLTPEPPVLSAMKP
jgi:hypothetical protein